MEKLEGRYDAFLRKTFPEKKVSNEQKKLKLLTISFMKQKHIYKKRENIKNKMKKKSHFLTNYHI